MKAGVVYPAFVYIYIQLLHCARFIQIILVLRGPYSPALVYLQLLLACHVRTRLITFERGYPYSLMIFIHTGTGIDIQAYLSPFLSLCVLSLTCYLLLVGLTALEGFPLDGRHHSLSSTGVVYAVRLATLGLVLGAQLIYAMQGKSLEPNQPLKSLIQPVNSFLEQSFRISLTQLASLASNQRFNQFLIQVIN